MIAQALREQAARDPHAPFLLDADGVLTYGAADRAVEALAATLGDYAGRSVGVVARGDRSTTLRVLALDASGARVCLLPPDVAPASRDALTSALAFAALVDGDEVRPRTAPAGAASAGTGELVVFSSGTTGVPKAILRTWADVGARVRRASSLASARWLYTYQLSSFAGLQVVLHGLLNGSALVLAPVPPTSVQAVLEIAVRHRATHLSLTPTLCRFLLAAATPEQLAEWPVQQVTLGGESIDQPVLDAVRRAFPHAQLTHIYASSEMGVCFSVHDGRAGFPASYLERADVPVDVRVRDGELLVRSPHRMRGYLTADQPTLDDDGFYATGDLVTLDGDRVYFAGRRGHLINVGGRKVFPTEVEAVLLELSEVRVTRVFGVPNSLTGQIVAAEVVLAPGVEPDAARAAVLAHCRTRLEGYKQPRQLAFVDAIDQTASGKVARRPA